MKYYVIQGLMSGLNGLVVEHDEDSEKYFDDDGHLANFKSVNRLIDRDSIIGDRHVAQPLQPQSLFISTQFLTKCDNPMERQFASDNPFGTFLGIEEFSRGDISTTLTLYENKCGVIVQERTEVGSKTLFSNYFHKDKLHELTDNLTKFFESDDQDDLVFFLNKMKGTESNG